MTSTSPTSVPTPKISRPHRRLQTAQHFNLERFPLPTQQSKLKLPSLPRLLTSDQTFLPYVSFHSLRPEPALSDLRFTTNGKSTLHTHTASLPGPRGPGSHDSDLTRPARPSVPVTSPLDHSPMPGAHPLRPSASPRRPSPSGDQGTCHRHRGTCPRLRRAPSIPSAASGLPLRPTPSRTRHLDHRAQAHGSRPSSRPKKPIVVVLDSTCR